MKLKTTAVQETQISAEEKISNLKTLPAYNYFFSSLRTISLAVLFNGSRDRDFL
jgi:hypothetical protein